MIGVYDYTVILTYLNFISGLTGIYFASLGNTFMAIFCLMFSGFCDMFDGKVAKTKKNRTMEEKKFGIQIDSLSDLVSFGILPSAIGYSIGVQNTYLAFSMYLLPLCALIRLAYYNVNEEERSSKSKEARKYYLGLPVTATAIIMPIIYLIKRFINKYFVNVYGGTLLIVSILFIKKFKVIKLDTKGLAIATCIGVIIFLLIILFRL